MQVFKVFFKIIKKNLGMFIMYFTIFMIIALMISKAQSDTGGTAEFTESSVKLTIIDRDKGEGASLLTGYVSAGQEVITLEDDTAVLQDALFYRETEYVLIIPEGFTEELLAGNEAAVQNVKVPDSVSGSFIDYQVEEYLRLLSAFCKTGYSLSEASSLAEEAANSATTVNMLGTQSSGSFLDSIYYYYQFLPYVFCAIAITALGPIFLAFNRTELHKRNLCGALSLKSRNLQLIAGSICFGIGCFVIFLLPAIFMYPQSVLSTGSLLCMVNMFVFMMISVAIGYLVGLSAKNQSVLSMFSTVIALGISFLGGVFVPQSVMSDSVLKVSRFLPSYWYVQVINLTGKNAAISSTQMNELIKALGIQLVFFVAILAVALVVSKRKTHIH